MTYKSIIDIQQEWPLEFNAALIDIDSVCVALFDINKELLFSNNAMNNLLKGDPWRNLINPSFEKLLSFDDSNNLIFEGVFTIGDYESINTSILAKVFKRDGKILIFGGIDTKQLIEQNATMHLLNGEINNLQRQLLKEKYHLETTLQNLNIANAELEKLNSDKDRFISILAHDLRNPFLSIHGLSKELSKSILKKDFEDVEELATGINTTISHTFNLLENMLKWARAESGKLPFKPREFNLFSSISEVFDSLNSSADLKDIEVALNIDKGYTIIADIDMLKTVLRNLISNAIKFTDTNGRISVCAEKDETWLTIIISDNGRGINEERVAHLFDIDKIKSTMGTKGERGTGFGLLICKEFVVMHGGKIWVESELGKGSSFKIALPI